MELEFHIQLLNTHLHIGHADLTTVNADVLVCPGNTYLSMSQGVALAINKKAGDTIGLDLRKHPLPAKLGAVIVTGAGQLPARYIFHVITGGYLLQTLQEVLTAHIIKEVLALGTMLKIQHIALPLIGSGIAGGSKVIALDCIVDATLHYIANNVTSIRHISIVIFEGVASGQVAEMVRPKNEAIQAIQTIMDKLQDLRNHLPDDADLQRVLEERLHRYQMQLSQLFFLPAMDSSEEFLDTNVLSPQAKHDATLRLRETLQQITNDLNHETAIKKIDQFHLKEYEKQAAAKGLATEPHIILEINELQRRIEQRTHKIEQLHTQKDAYANELKRLS